MSKRRIGDVIEGKVPVTGTASMTVRAACQLMASKKIGALLIVDGIRLAGIFTERDALNKVLAANLDPDTTTLDKVMVTRLQTIGPDKPLGHALLMMADGGFRHVPVVDAAGRAIGMVSARDALGEDIVEMEHDIKRMEALEGSIGY